MDKKNIAVLGTGTAGILAICHMLSYLSDDYEIYSISDPGIPSVGIGESTNPVFWNSMWKCLGISKEDIFKNNQIDATIKYGTLYKNWRKQDFLNPLFGEGTHSAVHFNTFKIKDFVFNIIKTKYFGRFKELYGTVNDIENFANCVQVSVNGEKKLFDYIIDCRGFPKDNMDNYNIVNLPLNHGLIHNVEQESKYDEWGYTLHQATTDGWMFGVPLTKRISYGYLFNDTVTDTITAKSNFANLINVDVKDIQDIEYKFRSYFAKKLINGRIILNGNASVFFEPMFANSLWLYDYNNRLIFDFITGTNPNINDINYKFYTKVKAVHDLICFYYQGGSNYDTEFWNKAKNYACECLKNSRLMCEIDNMFDFMKKSGLKLTTQDHQYMSPYSVDNLQKLDSFLGYNRWNLTEKN